MQTISYEKLKKKKRILINSKQNYINDISVKDSQLQYIKRKVYYLLHGGCITRSRG